MSKFDYSNVYRQADEALRNGKNKKDEIKIRGLILNKRLSNIDNYSEHT